MLEGNAKNKWRIRTMKKLLVATTNQGKLKEIKLILKGLPLEVVSLKDLNIEKSVREQGKTFEENAILKATAHGRMSGLLTMGEDSGLEVDALGGNPGVFSARYCKGSDEDRCKLVLKNLEKIPDQRRNARFRCAVAVFNPENNEVKTCEGVIEGEIIKEPRGENGFAYDPIFYVPELGKTTAQISPEEKNKISHRGEALRRAKKILEGLIK